MIEELLIRCLIIFCQIIENEKQVRKRKIFLLIEYGLSNISKPFLVVASGWLDAFIVRGIDRVGKGVRTAPGDAIIADYVTESISGKAFGIYRTIDQMAAIAGPLVTFAVLQTIDIQVFSFFCLNQELLQS